MSDILITTAVYIKLPHGQHFGACVSTLKLAPPICQVRMAERSKALRSGRSPLRRAWVQIPLLTNFFYDAVKYIIEWE